MEGIIKGRVFMVTSAKDLMPIVFDSGMTDWISDTSSADSEYKTVRRTYFQENGGARCDFCGYRGKPDDGSMEIIPLDGNCSNYDMKNLKAVCAHCRPCFNLKWAGETFDGVLAWMPEFEQYEISHFVRLRDFLNSMNDKQKGGSLGRRGAMADMNEMKNAVDILFEQMKGRHEYAARIIRTSSAMEAGEVIENMKKSIENYGDAGKLFAKGMAAGIGRNGEVYNAVGANSVKNQSNPYEQALKNMKNIFSDIRFIPLRPVFTHCKMDAQITTAFRWAKDRMRRS